MAAGPNVPEWRRAEIPGANGHATAEAIARIYSTLACGGRVDGSVGFADPEAKLSFGCAMNRMGPHILMDPRAQVLIDAAYASL